MEDFKKRTAIDIILYTLLIVSVIEVCIMLFFSYWGINKHTFLIAILDPLILTAISAPLIYLLIINPYITTNNQLHKSMVQNIITLIESRDPYTSGHMKRVANLSKLIAIKLNLPSKKIEGIFYSALVHDLGKIHIPAEILIYPGKLEKEAFALIMTHPKVGFDILHENNLPWPLAEVALEHHERLDGSGYPRGLTGDNICLEAQIVAVADVFDAMVSQRPYRPALNSEDVLTFLITQQGILFNKDAVTACVELIRTGQYNTLSEKDIPLKNIVTTLN